MPRALISVSDKRGVTQFARELAAMGWEIVSTGGTAHVITQSGVAVTGIEEVTGFPEIMDGRIKTLHPAVHASVLARRTSEAHMSQLEAHGFAPIDLVAVNLYPFRETIGIPDVKFEEAIEQIDIGGPSMLRSAAKNHAFVLAVVDPEDYERVLAALRENAVSDELRLQLAAKVFSHTSAYDAAIAQYLAKGEEDLPAMMGLALERVQALRYGENPTQRAALYVTGEGRGFDEMCQLHGKELSFNNLLDIEGATSAVAPWPDRPACAVIKHTTPCGIAVGATPESAYRRALATDPKSAFGSVVAFNTVVDAATAEAMHDLFVEVVVAPRFHDDAVAVYKRKKNLRVVELPLADSRPALDFKRVRGGFLVQDRFAASHDESEWKTVTKREPTESEWYDLRFAWAAVASVKSNAILLAKDEAAIGIGAGQMSRVDAAFLAVHKARDAGHQTQGAVLASDAFFPFADGVEQAAEAGISAIIQPGGSVRDQEVTAAADAHGIAMVFAGRRQFRH
ncbi:MAG: bifunctional phosphoribosylaminoimidazolecarboxamide formyltransferase/IMP cyclohydrolase [Gemmatimonadales bacterium]|nr:bifunctional phosphoribosylaminoimidazolecarboxamide formyltransferase/IMP cyclohydrolase [Gemmatimonadales bacterium]NIN10837.1 bifunctional phosphoribosylaminoimidazolecarboxamide formyltransferase/IMP cyclohydrolase [Gemmatimonadales bacterium]NIN49480.1 bifunctional phosphoribosylaminoimidazolecarboxamide formyltransferase/IMP cyclohydrolase [Gemmatimonadales bacterium]NIP06944.1 bifunctional phosphoribosylaminoimidazolecarboxamide formyltransferase/IMP cyclohydrolase [Gemmatimonadales ba